MRIYHRIQIKQTNDAAILVTVKKFQSWTMGQQFYIGIISRTRTTFSDWNFEMIFTVPINKSLVELVLTWIEIGIKQHYCYPLEYLSICLSTVEWYDVWFFPFIVCNFDNHPLYRVDLYVINKLILVLLQQLFCLVQ